MVVVGLERDGAHGFEIPSLDDCMEVVEGEVDIRSWDSEVLGYLARVPGGQEKDHRTFLGLWGRCGGVDGEIPQWYYRLRWSFAGSQRRSTRRR